MEAFVAASRALTSRADFNLPFKATRGVHHLVGVQDVNLLRVLFFFSPLGAHQSRFVCSKPCYAHFLLELLQIHLFADIYTSNPLEPPPPRGSFATAATYANERDF